MRLIFLISLFFIAVFAQGQKPQENFVLPKYDNEIRIGFYNVENAFDTENDHLKRDDEFTPEGSRFWSDRKMWKKLNDIAKVVMSMGEWEMPEIVGFCEIENRNVMDKLIQETALKKFNYQIVHKESPDRRGIDVSLIYLEEKLNLLKKEFLNITFPYDSSRKTRDVLYAQFKVYEDDTLHVYVNHWPSRWGGQLESEPGRMYVASVVKSHSDSIKKLNSLANIVIMGDFNDEPMDKSMYDVLNARKYEDQTDLVNLMIYLEEQGLGTHSYQSKWGVLDQFVVNRNMLHLGKSTLKVKDNSAQIMFAPFLMEVDEKVGGYKPYRTFIGFTYHGGYSDHMPIYLDLKKRDL